MIIKNRMVGDESGSVLITAVLVLLVLSVVVVMGANNSLFELKLSGNDRCLNDMKANAESAALAGLEQFKALGDASSVLRCTSWDEAARQAWYHQGVNNCVADATAYNGGDLNKDGETDEIYGTNLDRARAFSQYFLGSEKSDDNWDLGGATGIGDFASGSCAEVETASGDKIPSMENAKFMVIDTGPPPAKMADSMGISMDPDGNKSWHQILVTGVDEKCGGKYMVQIAYLVRF